MATENRLLRRDPGSHGGEERGQGGRKAGGNDCIRRISLIANPGRADFPSEIQLCDPKKARTHTNGETRQTAMLPVFSIRLEEGLKENRRRDACGNDIQCESINSGTLADIVSMHEKKLFFCDRRKCDLSIRAVNINFSALLFIEYQFTRF